ncbi:MAG TPA: CdaR family protein [Clostridia bacterium]|jgi:YbbR domain-containing protein|nr:CdaR family protein [Clostridia bacterium]
MNIPKIDKAKLLRGIKSFFTKNMALKVIAFVFAMLLWGYVLTDQKPMREKDVPNVATSFDGEAELIAQGFCVRGDRNEILQDVTVKVRTQITNYAYVTPSSIVASISLRNISEAREYDLPIQATVTSALGVVQSITPATVKVEIDKLVTKTVPITTTFSGELPEGYWADMDALTTTSRLDITGPKTDISTITHGECVVDLSEKTGTIYSTFDVTFYDKNNNIVSSDIIIGTLPTSTVRLPIYPIKNVPVDVESSLVGADNLAANHEIIKAVSTPETVRLVGDQATLDKIDTIALEPIAINGLDSTMTVSGTLIVPDGVRLLDSTTVSVLLEVREMVITQTFEQLEIQVHGRQSGGKVSLNIPAGDLIVEGRYSLVSMLSRSDVQLFVDVTGLTPGVYKLPVSVLVRDAKATIELTTTLSVTEVTVTIDQPK